MVSSTTEENIDQKTLDFTIVDVFARRLFEGNQLAVVRTDQKHTSDQMMEITREFGYSETTSIVKSASITEEILVLAIIVPFQKSGHYYYSPRFA